jgi:hypothetical protein
VEELTAAKIETLTVKIELGLASIDRQLQELLDSFKSLKADTEALDKRVTALEYEAANTKGRLIWLMSFVGIGGSGLGAVGGNLVKLLMGGQ